MKSINVGRWNRVSRDEAGEGSLYVVEEFEKPLSGGARRAGIVVERADVVEFALAVMELLSPAELEAARDATARKFGLPRL